MAASRPAEKSTTSDTSRLPDSRLRTARGGGSRLTAERLHALAEPERDVALAELVQQLVDDLAIEELERPLAALDQRHLNADGGEHRRVLDADHAGADHGQVRGSFLRFDELVAS